jgi:uncharacterized protein
LLIDVQATGETKGDRITFGWKESRDVLAAVTFIRKMQPSDRIAIIGSSLGGAAALLATPPLEVDSLILEAVYPTIEIATNNRLQNYLGPIGRSIAPLLLMQLQARLGVSTSDLRPIDHIEKVSCPILLMSGEKDRNTRPEDTRMLVSRVQSPKQLCFVAKRGSCRSSQGGDGRIRIARPCISRPNVTRLVDWPIFFRNRSALTAKDHFPRSK